MSGRNETGDGDRGGPLTQREAMEMAIVVSQQQPDVMNAVIVSVLKAMPRQQYLRFIQQLERERS